MPFKWERVSEHAIKFSLDGLSAEDDAEDRCRLAFLVQPGRSLSYQLGLQSTHLNSGRGKTTHFHVTDRFDWSLISADCWDVLCQGFPSAITYERLRNRFGPEFVEVPNYWGDPRNEPIRAMKVGLVLRAPDFSVRDWWGMDFAVSRHLPRGTCTIRLADLLQHGMVAWGDRRTAFLWHDKSLRVASQSWEWDRGQSGPGPGADRGPRCEDPRNPDLIPFPGTGFYPRPPQTRM